MSHPTPSAPPTEHTEAGLLEQEFGSTWQLRCDEALHTWTALQTNGTSLRYLVAHSAGELLAKLRDARP
jgi:hypothetical protein